jgi:8-oxo-dGTP diphosphatase
MKKTKQITIFSGCVIHEDKVLMVKRNEEECPEAHLKWEFPGGKVDFGETPEESVFREIFEETGVKAKIIKLLPFVNTTYWEYEWGTQQTLCFVFLCEFISQVKIEKDHHVEEISWMETKKIMSLDCLPGTKEVLVYL